jgi:DNA-binding IclR family transcriptional regulator
VVAALSIAGPVSRLNRDSSKSHHRLVADYSERISRALGGRKMTAEKASR